jgi:hypothetical protein
LQSVLPLSLASSRPLLRAIPTHILLAERVDELREDVVRDDSLREIIRVVCEAPERERRRLLDARDLFVGEEGGWRGRGCRREGGDEDEGRGRYNRNKSDQVQYYSQREYTALRHKLRPRSSIRVR